jgi:hypothetical protein
VEHLTIGARFNGPDGSANGGYTCGRIAALMGGNAEVTLRSPDRGETLLGRFAVAIDELPEPGEPCVVLAWPLGEEGRKLYAATALYGEHARPLARAQAAWITPSAL